MGARTTRSLGRGLSRTLLLLLVALVAAVAVPGGQADAASKKKPPGDPPGNNGTIKIERDSATDEDLGNEPHGDQCRIWVEFYGFDKNQMADITLRLQSPTKPKDGSDGVLAQVTRQIGEEDAAGGGPNDPEPTWTYAFDLQGPLTGVEAHPQQGYHIKLSVDVKDAPGASKHKVFWMGACPPQPPPQSAAASTLRIAKEQVGTGQGPFKFSLVCDNSTLDRDFELNAGGKRDIADVPPGTTCKVTETDKKGAETTTVTEDPVTGATDDGEVTTIADKSTIVTFKNKFPGDQVVAAPPNEDIRPPAGTPAGTGGNPGTSVGGNNTSQNPSNPGTSVLGGSETAPDATLPRTGTDPRPLTATGLSALAAGAALLAGSRRRRS